MEIQKTPERNLKQKKRKKKKEKKEKTLIVFFVKFDI